MGTARGSVVENKKYRNVIHAVIYRRRSSFETDCDR